MSLKEIPRHDGSKVEFSGQGLKESKAVREFRQNIDAFLGGASVFRAFELGEEESPLINCSSEWIAKKITVSRSGGECMVKVEGYPHGGEWDSKGDHYGESLRLDGNDLIITRDVPGNPSELIEKPQFKSKKDKFTRAMNIMDEIKKADDAMKERIIREGLERDIKEKEAKETTSQS